MWDGMLHVQELTISVTSPPVHAGEHPHFDLFVLTTLEIALKSGGELSFHSILLGSTGTGKFHVIPCLGLPTIFYPRNPKLRHYKTAQL